MICFFAGFAAGTGDNLRLPWRLLTAAASGLCARDVCSEVAWMILVFFKRCFGPFDGVMNFDLYRHEIGLSLVLRCEYRLQIVFESKKKWSKQPVIGFVECPMIAPLLKKEPLKASLKRQRLLPKLKNFKEEGLLPMVEALWATLRHGYAYLHHRDSHHASGRPAAWGKVAAMQEALKDGRWDWVVWIDCDPWTGMLEQGCSDVLDVGGMVPKLMLYRYLYFGLEDVGTSKKLEGSHVVLTLHSSTNIMVGLLNETLSGCRGHEMIIVLLKVICLPYKRGLSGMFSCFVVSLKHIQVRIYSSWTLKRPWTPSSWTLLRATRQRSGARKTEHSKSTLFEVGSSMLGLWLANI